jgi:hypothetical protein
MFGQKPKVAADGLVIGPLPTADAAFIQRWQIPATPIGATSGGFEY